MAVLRSRWLQEKFRSKCLCVKHEFFAKQELLVKQEFCAKHEFFCKKRLCVLDTF